MNKNDFEVYIFNQIITDPNYAGKNDYELSTELAIPQAKVKRLRYESNLKYGRNNAEVYNQQFREVLMNAKPQQREGSQVLYGRQGIVSLYRQSSQERRSFWRPLLQLRTDGY